MSEKPLRLWLAVASGAFLGTQLRYWLLSVAPDGPSIPMTTLAINISGTALAAIFTGWCSRRDVSSRLRAAVSVGLLGSFTTFSAFAFVLHAQLSSFPWTPALLYALLSLGLGSVAALGGLLLGARLAPHTSRGS